MKGRNITAIKYPLFLVASLLILSSCGSQSTSDKDKQAPEEEEHDHGHEDELALSTEQIAAVGIAWDSIEQRPLSEVLKLNGSLRVPNNKQANATTLFGGVIKALDIELGDRVRKGQVLARIENPQFIQLQEDYLTMDSRIVFAEQEKQRQILLQEGGAGALKNRQNAEAEINSLRARKASLQKQLQLMGISASSISRDRLHSSLLVTSPIDGIVSAVYAKIGSYVDVSSPIAEIVDNSQLHVDMQIFEKDLNRVKLGQSMTFALTNSPERTYDATVFNIGSSFDNSSQTISVHGKVNGSITGLIHGMHVTGLIHLSEVKQSALPNEAFVSEEGKDYVFYLLEEESTAKKKTFKRVQVIKGVSELGYTAFKTLEPLPEKVQVVRKGAFFVQAQLADSGEGHSH